MSDSWVSLREFAEHWVDELIRNEPNPEARAVLVRNYDAVAARVEADVQRQLAEQMAQDTRH